MKCLVVGGTGGLGQNLVTRLLKYRVSVISAQRTIDRPLFEKFANIAGRANVTFSSSVLDMETYNGANMLVDEKPIDFSTIDHIVFCHGLLIPGTLESLRKKDFHTSFEVNCWGPLTMCKQAILTWKKLPIKNRSITYISSVSTRTGSVDEISYHLSKRAMESVILSIARDNAHHQIRANVVSPGIMNVGMGLNVIKRRPALLERITLGKAVTPEQVSEAVYFMMKSDSVTGQNIQINGGRVFSI